jgi:hypothetical protein
MQHALLTTIYEILEFFYWHNPSGRTMTLGLPQPPTEMSTRNIFLEVVKVAGAYGWQPYHLYVLSWNLGASTSWNPQGLSRPVMELIYLYIYIYIWKLSYKTSMPSIKMILRHFDGFWKNISLSKIKFILSPKTQWSLYVPPRLSFNNYVPPV